MKIAIIAHDSKKYLMIDLCIAYCGILSKHEICSTSATGKNIHDATGLSVERMLTGGSGGIEQVASRISCNEVQLLLYFKSNNLADPEMMNSAELLRLCDIYNIPVATNLATAEAILLALDRGDLDYLDWRKKS